MRRSIAATTHGNAVIRAIQEVDALWRRAARVHVGARRERVRRGSSRSRRRSTNRRVGGAPHSCRVATITRRYGPGPCTAVGARSRRAVPRGRRQARRRRRLVPGARRPSAPSITMCVGVTTPPPKPARNASYPRTASVDAGIPVNDPGVTRSDRAGRASATSTAVPAARNARGWRMIRRASRPQKRPSRRGAETWRPSSGEQRRLQRQRSERSTPTGNEQAADSHRPDEGHRHEEQQPEPDRDGAAGEDDGAAGGRHRPADRGVDVPVVRDLLAEAVHDQQRVIDRETRARPARRGSSDVSHHRDVVREQPDDSERRRDRARSEDERDQDREGQAQDEPGCRP